MKNTPRPGHGRGAVATPYAAQPAIPGDPREPAGQPGRKG